VKRLHIISYLAPSVPADFFRLIAGDLDATLEGAADAAEIDSNVLRTRKVDDVVVLGG